MSIIYQTTNNVNNKIYIGVHSGNDPSYLGSGKLLKQAIRKYGKAAFTRTVLYEFDTIEQAFAKEAEIVNENFIARDDVYNIMPGGKGMVAGPLNPNYGKRQSADWIARRTACHKNKVVTERQKQKQSLAMTGKIRSKKSRAKQSSSISGKHHWNYGQTHSEDTLKKMRASALRQKKITCPHCKKTGDKANMKRWHFDNCKSIFRP